MTNDEIKELALASGFKLKEQPGGTEDLNPYVYEFARRLLINAADQPSPDVTYDYPMQPVRLDRVGRTRFEENPIVSWLARDVSDLNAIAIWCIEHEVDPKYQEQLAQLIGYSIDGYGELSYVTDASYDRAEKAVAALRAGGDS